MRCVNASSAEQIISRPNGSSLSTGLRLLSSPLIAGFCHAAFVSVVALGLSGCKRNVEPVLEGSGHSVLSPVSATGQSLRQRQVVYVPVYSSIYWGSDRQLTDLAATLSIRNVSEKAPILVHAVKYYDSHGKLIRLYINEPGSLGPLATADFVIQRRDTAGGPGANFLVEWSSVEDVDDPVIEAVMIGQHGNVGISFTSLGRPLPKASSALRVAK